MLYCWNTPAQVPLYHIPPQAPVPVSMTNGGGNNSVTPPTPSEGGSSAGSSNANQQSGSGSPASNGTAAPAAPVVNATVATAPPTGVMTNGQTVAAATPHMVYQSVAVPAVPSHPAAVAATNGGGHHHHHHMHNGHHAHHPGGHRGQQNGHRQNGGLSQRSNHEQLSKTNLYIRGLPQNTTDEDLYKMCKNYGKIVSTKAIVDPATNLCKGYGFVDFDRFDSAQKAVIQLKSNGIQAQMAKQQEQDPTNLYISNLPRSVTETELESLLAAFGSVISTRILRDNSGLSKGVGFARMESKEKCEQIIHQFNGKYLHQIRNGTPPVGAVEPLLCKFADGGPKKTKHHPKFINGTNNPRVWRDDLSYSAYEVPAMSHTNGHVPNRIMVQPLPNPTAYPVNGPVWLHQPPYMMPPAHLPPNGVFPPMDQNVALAPGMVPPQIPSLAAQFNGLQLGPPPAAASAAMSGWKRSGKTWNNYQYTMPPPPPQAQLQYPQIQPAVHVPTVTAATTTATSNNESNNNNNKASASPSVETTTPTPSAPASAVKSVVVSENSSTPSAPATTTTTTSQ